MRTCGATRNTSVLLEAGDSPYDDNYFPYVPFFAYRGRDIDYCIIRNLIDPQREVNKRDSQLLHLLNSAPKARVITDDPTLADKYEAGDEILTVAKGTQHTIIPPP